MCLKAFRRSFGQHYYGETNKGDCVCKKRRLLFGMKNEKLFEKSLKVRQANITATCTVDCANNEETVL